MAKKTLSTLLALVLCLSLLPGTALAAEQDLPDWYFLFAIFKNVDAECADGNGNTVHTTYTMSQEELDFLREDARLIQEFLDSVGVMRAHMDVVEIDETVTELEETSLGSQISTEQAAPLLAKKVDLDRYDHVTCAVCLNVDTAYLGLGGSSFENGTGHTCMNFENLKTMEVLTQREGVFLASGLVHEFLHFMERMNRKWGAEFGLHDIRINHYTPDPDQDCGRTCYTDIFLNRARGDAGTGVYPAVWQYPPRVLRTMTELTVPAGVTAIGPYAFQNRTNLTKVTIPGSVANIEKYSFCDCTSLAELTILPGVTSIGDWAFGCSQNPTALAKVSIPASVTSIGSAAFYNASLKDIYYAGTEEQWKAIQIGESNESLTKAAIHYNSTIAEVSSISDDGRSVTLLTYPDNLLADCKTVYAASYYGNGRFAGIVRGTLRGGNRRIHGSGHQGRPPLLSGW